MGFIRRTSRPQGDRSILEEQDNFGEGLNVDLPASDINNNSSQNLENYIAFERYLEGRSGSVNMLDISSVTGTIHDIKEHPENNIVLMHRGSKLYDMRATIQEIQDFSGASLGFDVDSEIREFGDDFLVFTQSGLFRVSTKSNPAIFFQINGDRPKGITSAPTFVIQQPFKYKYVYVFSTLVVQATGLKAGTGTDRLTSGVVILHETPPVLASESAASDSFFKNQTTVLAISAANPQVVFLNVLDQAGVPDYITHVSFYRTPDLGQNGLNNSAFEQFAFTGDFWLDKGDLTLGFSDETEDPVINANLLSGPRLQTVGMTALPSGDVGEVTEGFVFSSLRNEKTISYSQRVPDDTNAGFFDAGKQFFEVDDGIQVLAKTPDILSMICNRKSYISALTAFGETGTFASVIVLQHISIADDTIGVTDPYSFVKVEQGTYISICSDSSVRQWDAGGWSGDLAIDRVRKIIETIRTGFTVGAYFRGAYLIWYTTDQNATKPDSCIRLSVKRESGKGWTKYTGDDLVIPPAKTGAFVTSDFVSGVNNGFQFLFVVDDTDDRIYWMETYTTSSNITLGENSEPAVAYFADKVDSILSANGTNIECLVNGKDKTGARESFNIIHQESHAYLRDLLGTSEPITYPSLLVDALAFVNGSTTAIEAVGKVSTDGDIQFWRRVEGSRISVEFRTNRSGHRLIGIDSRYRVQDINRPNRGPTTTVASTFQLEFMNNMVEWHLTRPRVFTDRTRLANTPNGLIPTTTGPDGRTKAIKINTHIATGDTNRFVFPKSKIVTSSQGFTVSFFISSVDIVTTPELILMRFDNGAGVPSMTIILVSETSVKIDEGTGTVTLDDLSATGPLTNGFHHLIFVRQASSSTVTVYQNNLLKGTLTFSTSFGGGDYQIGNL